MLIAAREGVRDPAEEPLRQLLADQQLEPEYAAGACVVEDLLPGDPSDRLHRVGADDQIVQALVEPH